MLTIAALLHGSVAVQGPAAIFSAEGAVQISTGTTCPVAACHLCNQCRTRPNREYSYHVTCIRPKQIPCTKIKWCADFAEKMINQCYQEKLQQRGLRNGKWLKISNVAPACITQGLCRSSRTTHCPTWRRAAKCHVFAAQARARATAKGLLQGPGRVPGQGMLDTPVSQVHRASGNNDVHESEALIGRAHAATTVESDLDTSVQGKCGA